jgi:hypothetical protein
MKKTVNKKSIVGGIIGSLITGGIAGIALASQHHTTMRSIANSHDRHSQHGENGDDRQENNDTQAILTVDRSINANQLTTLKLNIRDREGKAITNFDVFQEKLMHLIVVSDDLQFFNHLHPELQKDGSFTVETTFPQGGKFTFFSDYKPKGRSERVSVINTEIVGAKKVDRNVSLETTKTIDNTQASLSFTPQNIEAGKESHLIFNLKDITTNKPPEDLQPYLGELGHLVILKQSSPLTKEDYIHAHAMKNTPTGEIHFMATFPRSGKYKMWGQFNRNGKIVVADFWVEVR